MHRAHTPTAPVSNKRTASGAFGRGGDEGDLELFMGMDQAQQTGVIREGFEPVVVTRIARELLDVQAKTLLGKPSSAQQHHRPQEVLTGTVKCIGRRSRGAGPDDFRSRAGRFRGRRQRGRVDEVSACRA
jgi:hypothetical protein